MRGLYVVGTAPGVGTTTVSVALIRALRSRGLQLSAFKPVEVGCSIAKGGGVVDGIPGGELSVSAQRAYARLNELVGPPSIAVSTKTEPEALRPADSERLHAALDGRVPIALINCFRFSPRVSPAVAAKLAERPIGLEVLRQQAEKAAEEADLLVVDGVGGVMELLDGELKQRDLIAGLGLAVLLVSTTERNAINQVLLAREALDRCNVVTAGVVLRRMDKRPRPEEAAVPLMIEAAAGDIVRGVLPLFESSKLDDLAWLGERFEVHVDVDALIAAMG